MDESTQDSIYKAKYVWKWKNPWLAAGLALLHPIFMLYYSWRAALGFSVIGVAMGMYFGGLHPLANIAFAIVCAVYSFYSTRYKNAGIERYRYGLNGTGLQNPAKLGVEPIVEQSTRRDIFG